MSTHNIGFYEDLTKIIFELSSNIIKYAPYFFCCLQYSLLSAVLKTNEKMAELMIFMFVNMCSQLQLNKYEVLDMLHVVVFNDTEEGRLQLHDFIRKAADKDE